MRKVLTTTCALTLGLFAAYAELTPYSWQRFDQLRNPGADATGNNHPITGGFTGNGESPFGTLPVVDNVCVGGPLGPEGVFSRNSIRGRANQFNNQGTMFCEPVPLNTATLTNSSPWGNFFQTNDNWVVESWVLPSRTGVQNLASPIFATGLNRNNRAQGRQSGIAMVLINGTNGTQNAVAPNVNGTADNSGHVWVRCQAMAPAGATNSLGQPMNFYIGPPVLVKSPTNAEWMHVAVVRDTVAGTVSWYTNGTMVAATNISKVYTTNYFSCIGVAGIQDSGYGDQYGPGLGGASQAFESWMAELRWSSFLPGTFSTTNLLTRRVAPGSPTVWYGPVIVKDPQNTTVWSGSGASFACVAASDTTLQYQWQRFSGSWANIANATNRLYNLENLALGDNGAQFRCILTKPINSLTATSTVATLTVLANSPAFVTGYSNAIMAESSLLAYFPMDGTGATLNNVKEPTRNGSISNAPFAFRSGRTNQVGGNQGLSLNLPNFEYTGGFGLKTNENGFVEIPGDNPAFDFATASAGNGTIEAVLYADPSMANTLLTSGSSEVCVWLSSASIYNASGTSTKPAFDYYTFGVDGLGSLHYRNSSGTGFDLIWTVPGGMFGQRRHVAFVFSELTNVTCYVDGVNLGTKTQPGFGNTPPSATQPLTIGKGGGAYGDLHGYMRDSWRGTVDELAIYGAALTESQVQNHVYRLNNGSTDTPASIVKITPSKSLFTGFPVQRLNVQAGGNPPFTYQWRSNNLNIASATNSSYDFVGTGVPAGVYPFSVVVQGGFGGAITSAPIALTVVNPSGYSAKVYASSGGGPKAFYPLDETSGINVLDWAGTHDGELSGAYELGNVGPAGGTGSLRMFGTNVVVAGVTVPSKVEVPYYPELNPENNGNFSHEFWYRPDDTNTTVCPVSSQANIGFAKAGLATMNGPGINGIAQTTINNWTMIYGKYNNVNQGVAQNGTGGAIPAVPGEWQHVVSVADGDASTVTIYVNGNPDFTQNVGYSQHPGDGSTTGGVNQNYYAPLLLGNYNGTYAFPIKGRLSQVAIYDYALTFTDITNHTSQIWTQAIVTLQPVGATNIESFTASVTLTGNALGVPNNYQWLKDGVDLVQTYNLDGSEHYPRIPSAGGDLQGVNSKKLVISQTKTNDTGLYTLRIFNPQNAGGSTNTTTVSVRITNDFVAPVATNVSARGVVVSGPVLDEAMSTSGSPTPASLFLVEVRYTERMDWASVTNPANYTISGPGSVTVTNVVLANSLGDAKFAGDYRAVGLLTTGLTPGADYTLTINNVYDQASFSNKIAATTRAFRAPSLRTGTAVWNYYYRMAYGGTTFGALSSGTNSVFPYVPQYTANLTNFSSDAVAYNQNLGNNAIFSGQSDAYVSTLTAWVTPTNTGYYEFWINGDDASRLYLNPNGADPAGATYIGERFSGSLGFSNFFAIPTHYHLTAGQPYFMQAVHTENTGGDHVRVGWRYLGTVDQGYDGSGANGAWIVDEPNIPIIAGHFLSSYAYAGPTITAQPTSIQAAAGVTTNLAVTAISETGVTNYQWLLNNAATGTSTNRLFFTPLAFANFSTNYKVAVSDGSLSVTSATVTVTPPLPSIGTAPSGKAVPLGLGTSLLINPSTFSGRTNYQWRLTTTNVAGVNYNNSGTNKTLTITSMQASNAGPYTVVVNDGFNALSLTSSPAATLTLAVNQIISSSLSGTTLNLNFPTESGPQYVVEYKNALTNGAWIGLSTNAGTGVPITVPVTTTNTQRYFRLRMQ